MFHKCILCQYLIVVSGYFTAILTQFCFFFKLFHSACHNRLLYAIQAIVKCKASPLTHRLKLARKKMPINISFNVDNLVYSCDLQVDDNGPHWVMHE